MSKCILSFNEEEHAVIKSSKIICNTSIEAEYNQEDFFDITENKLTSEFSSKKISFKDINFGSTSKSYNELEHNQNDFEGYACSPNLYNIEDSSEYLEDMSFELEENNTNLLQDFENTLQEYRDLSEEIYNNTEISEDIRNNSDNDEVNHEYDSFPNEAYADLMVLVTKYKLSNAAGNAIISFFNKHSNNLSSPLPKNITQGKQYMDNMKSNLKYKKTKIFEHNNTEYFLYHMPLIRCIENILKIPNISQNFALEFEELYKTTEV
jgi:hypothetical protein